MDKLVGYFDILGTKYLVDKNEFDEYASLDYTNVAGIVAASFKNCEIDIFSDSVIFSSSIDDWNKFIDAIRFMFQNWCQDGILVRGAICLGEIYLIKDETTDSFFEKQSNLRISRIFGKALNEAVRLEKNSGSGMICFLDKKAADFFSVKCPDIVYNSNPPIFIWPTIDNHYKYVKIFELRSRTSGLTEEQYKQINSTLVFLKSTVNEEFLAEAQALVKISSAVAIGFCFKQIRLLPSFYKYVHRNSCVEELQFLLSFAGVYAGLHNYSIVLSPDDFRKLYYSVMKILDDRDSRDSEIYNLLKLHVKDQLNNGKSIEEGTGHWIICNLKKRLNSITDDILAIQIGLFLFSTFENWWEQYYSHIKKKL